MAKQASSWCKSFRIASLLRLLLSFSAAVTWSSQALAAQLVTLECQTIVSERNGSPRSINAEKYRLVINLEGKTMNGDPVEVTATHIKQSATTASGSKSSTVIDRATLRYEYSFHGYSGDYDTREIAQCAVVPTVQPKF